MVRRQVDDQGAVRCSSRSILATRLPDAVLPSDHVHYVQEYNDVEAILTLAENITSTPVYPGMAF